MANHASAPATKQAIAGPEFHIPPRHVVCATDLAPGTLDAERAAFEVARAFGARLTFVWVDPTFVYHAELLASSGGLASGSFDPQRQKTYLARRAEELRAHLGPLSHGQAFFVVTDSGEPSLSLLGWLKSHEQTDVPRADLVVVGRKQRGALHNLFLGSTANSLLEEAHIPVMVVPEKSCPERPDGFLLRDVALASDLSNLHEAPAELAARFCHEVHGTLTLVHSFESQGYRPVPPEYFANEEMYRELADLFSNASDIKTRQLAKEAESIAKEHDVNCVGRLLEGSPKEALLEFVRERRPQLLVVGRWTNASGLATLFLGSTARALAMHAATPVLVVPHTHD